MKKSDSILCLLCSILLLCSLAGCARNQTGTEPRENVCAYLREIKGSTITLDTAEYITTEDSKRMAELGLTEDDMPDGYYIYNPDEQTEDYNLTDDTEYNFIDWNRYFVGQDASDQRYSTKSKEDFTKYIQTYENSRPGMPFFFDLKGNDVISITEEPMA